MKNRALGGFECFVTWSFNAEKNGNEIAERNASLNNLFLGRLGIFGCLNKSRRSYKMYVVSVPMKRYSAFRVLLT